MSSQWEVIKCKIACDLCGGGGKLGDEVTGALTIGENGGMITCTQPVVC